MEVFEEKREEKRRCIKAPIIFRKFFDSDRYPAEILNHSRAGVAFKGDVAMKPGAILHIRRIACAENCTMGEACEGCRSTTLAEVKWCKGIQKTSRDAYLVGAKYFEYGL